MNNYGNDFFTNKDYKKRKFLIEELAALISIIFSIIFAVGNVFSTWSLIILISSILTFLLFLLKFLIDRNLKKLYKPQQYVLIGNVFDIVGCILGIIVFVFLSFSNFKDYMFILPTLRLLAVPSQLVYAFFAFIQIKLLKSNSYSDFTYDVSDIENKKTKNSSNIKDEDIIEVEVVDKK